MTILAILFIAGGVEGGFKPTKPRGSSTKMQGDGPTTQLGGIMEVAMFGFDVAWL